MPDGQRKTIRLTGLNKAKAEQVGRHIDELVQAKGSGQPTDRQTSLWLAEIGQKLHDKLSNAGLIEQRASSNLGDFIRSALHTHSQESPRMASPDSQNDSTIQDNSEGVVQGYPQRPKFWANRVIRKMNKSCAANEIGPEGFTLVSTIAMTEDAKRYLAAVTFFNGQLMPITGLRSESRLDRTRKRCIETGWLHYEPGTKSTPGRYWTLIPEHAEPFSDAPIDDDAFDQSGFPPDSPNESRGNPETIREASAKNPKSKHRTFIPSPNPSPVPKENERTLSRPKKAGRSPPPLADQLPPFDEIERYWNESFGVSHTLTDSRRDKLKTRWKDATFRTRWREAIDRMSVSDFCRGLNDRRWIANLDFFLKPDTLTKTLDEGIYDNRNKFHPTRHNNSAAAREQANANAFDILESAIAASSSEGTASIETNPDTFGCIEERCSTDTVRP